MKRLQDLSSVMQSLRRGIEAGLWTLEDLDKPTKGWLEATDTSYSSLSLKAKQEGTVYNENFGESFKPPVYRNLLRDGPPRWKKSRSSTRDLPYARWRYACAARRPTDHPRRGVSLMSTEYIARAISEAATDLMPIDRDYEEALNGIGTELGYIGKQLERIAHALEVQAGIES